MSAFDIQKIRDPKVYISVNRITTLKDYILKGASSVISGKDEILRSSKRQNIYIAKQNIIYSLNDEKIEMQFLSGIDLIDILSLKENLKCDKAIGIKFDKDVVLLNSDIKYTIEQIDEELAGTNMPTASFLFIQKLYRKKINILSHIKSKFKLIDYELEEKIPLNFEERKCRNKSKLIPPKSRFSINYKNWHRYQSVLLNDPENKMWILAGEDEGAYFVQQLPKRAKNIDDAFNSLVPKQAIGKEYDRQGKWFIVPVDKSEVPDHGDCVSSHNESICLPLENNLDKTHHIRGEDVRVGKNNVIYANNFQISHDYYAPITKTKTKGWFAFYRNNSVRYFEQFD